LGGRTAGRGVHARLTELAEANVRLDEATRAKSEFLAAMSHELRTPLNSIIGFASVLGQGMAGDLNPEQQKQVRMILSSGKHLLGLVGGVLDLSRIEAGRVEVERERFDVAAAVDAIAGSVGPQAADKSLELSWDVAPDVGSMSTDRMRLDQVLLNLLGNAIKFTDSGSVVLRVRRHADIVEFAVSDTGCGIASGDIPRVVEEPYYQVRRVGEAKVPGAGLGLPVSKQLVELLGGTLDVESEVGVGSTFTVRLPDAGTAAVD
jgi:signal transduction histidine kinase